MTGIIQWGMRQSAEVENQMMAVERVLEYVQLPPEPNLKDRGAFLKKKDKQNLTLPAEVPKTWPDEACIKFKNVYMRYADDDPPVLKNLNIVIYPGEKVFFLMHLCTIDLTIIRISQRETNLSNWKKFEFFLMHYNVIKEGKIKDEAIKWNAILTGWHCGKNRRWKIVAYIRAIPFGKGGRSHRD